MHRHRGGFGSFSGTARRVHPLNMVPLYDRGGIRL